MILTRDSLVVQMVKNVPAKQETQVQSLGGEDPLVFSFIFGCAASSLLGRLFSLVAVSRGYSVLNGG